MDDIILYNQYLSEQFQKTKDVHVLERFVLSELCAPIADFPNAIQIIRQNYKEVTSYRLLVIGAHIQPGWDDKQNEFLDILDAMCPFLCSQQQSVIWWLHALDTRIRDEHYKTNEKYREFLTKSVQCDSSSVFNLLEYINIFSHCGFTRKDVLNNVQKVYSHEELKSLNLCFFTDPEEYIAEHLLGTRISYLAYQDLLDNKCLP